MRHRVTIVEKDDEDEDGLHSELCAAVGLLIEYVPGDQVRHFLQQNTERQDRVGDHLSQH
jgi:hypothetical protein